MKPELLFSFASLGVAILGLFVNHWLAIVRDKAKEERERVAAIGDSSPSSGRPVFTKTKLPWFMVIYPIWCVIAGPYMMYSGLRQISELKSFDGSAVSRGVLSVSIGVSIFLMGAIAWVVGKLGSAISDQISIGRQIRKGRAARIYDGGGIKPPPGRRLRRRLRPLSGRIQGPS